MWKPKHLTKERGKNGFPKKYEPTAFKIYADKAKEAYEDGNYIEAFVFLHSTLEAYLLACWSSFKYLFSKEKIGRISNPKKWDYLKLVDVLNEVNILSDSQASDFKKFNEGRNKIIHEIASPMKSGKLNQKLIDEYFKIGKKAFDDIYDITVKLAPKMQYKITLLDDMNKE